MSTEVRDVATVKTHITHLFTKLEATNRLQIARIVHDAGIGE